MHTPLVPTGEAAAPTAAVVQSSGDAETGEHFHALLSWSVAVGRAGVREHVVQAKTPEVVIMDTSVHGGEVVHGVEVLLEICWETEGTGAAGHGTGVATWLV